MIYIKTLTYLASLKVYYHCYKIIEHFISRTYYYCFYNTYQGCFWGPFPFGEEDYCCVCKTRNHYSLEELNSIKHNNFKFEKYYLNILRDLTEIEKIDPTICFWEDKFYCKFRNKQEGTEGQTCLRNVIDYLFNTEID